MQKLILQLALNAYNSAKVRIGFVLVLLLMGVIGTKTDHKALLHLAATTTIATGSALVTYKVTEATQLKSLRQRLNDALRSNAQFEAQLNTLRYEYKELSQKRDALAAMREDLRNALQTALNNAAFLQRQNDALGARVEELQAELHEADTNHQETLREFRQENETLRVRLEAREQPHKDRIRDLEGRLGNVNKTLDEYDKLLEQKGEEVFALEAEKAELAGQVNGLRQALVALNAPKKLPEGTDLNNFSNKVIDWFMGVTPAIELDALEAKLVGHDWKLRYKLRNPQDKLRLPHYETQLKLDFGLPQKPTFNTRNDETTLTIYRGDEVQYSSRVRFAPEWVKDAFVVTDEATGRPRTHHARITGRSGSGKSALVNNLIGALVEEIPNVKFVLLDPIAASKSGWYREPDAKGREACLAKLAEVYEEMVAREEGNSEDRTPIVLVLDEFDGFSANEGVLAKMKAIWKRGRHTEVFGWALGQTSLVGDVGDKKDGVRLTRNDVDNTIGVYISNTIDRGLTDINVTPLQNSQLREDWLTNANKRVALVRPSTVGKSAFIAILPEPDTYSPPTNAVQLVDVEGEVRRLAAEGKTVTQIAEEVFKVHRGGNKAFREAKAQVMELLETAS